MSSLDEVYQQMRAFQSTLVGFNEELRAAAASLAKAHEDVCGLWQDQAALRYRQAYQPLAHSLDQYLRAEAPRFERFMQSKVGQLERYLQG